MPRRFARAAQAETFARDEFEAERPLINSEERWGRRKDGGGRTCERAYLLGLHCRRPAMSAGAFEAPDANLTNLTPATAAGPGARTRVLPGQVQAASDCTESRAALCVKSCPFWAHEMLAPSAELRTEVATSGSDCGPPS